MQTENGANLEKTAGRGPAKSTEVNGENNPGVSVCLRSGIGKADGNGCAGSVFRGDPALVDHFLERKGEGFLRDGLQ